MRTNGHLRKSVTEKINKAHPQSKHEPMNLTTEITTIGRKNSKTSLRDAKMHVCSEGTACIGDGCE